jgi:hypothetical protein
LQPDLIVHEVMARQLRALHRVLSFLYYTEPCVCSYTIAEVGLADFGSPASPVAQFEAHGTPPESQIGLVERAASNTTTARDLRWSRAQRHLGNPR